MAGSDSVFVYSLSFCVGSLVSGGVLVVLSRLAIILLTSCEPRREKTCLRGFAKNTGADQPSHTRSLIIAFVIHF